MHVATINKQLQVSIYPSPTSLVQSLLVHVHMTEVNENAHTSLSHYRQVHHTWEPTQLLTHSTDQ